jgi:hypothetical protein
MSLIGYRLWLFLCGYIAGRLNQIGVNVASPGYLSPNGAKTQLLMHTNTNYLLDLYILLGLFDRGYQLMA